MAKKNILSLILLIIIIEISYIYSYVILSFNFSSKNKNKNNFISEPKNYFDYYINNTIFTHIKVDDILITFKLSMELYSTYISDKIYTPKNEEAQEIRMEKNYSLNYINLNKVKMLYDTFDFNTIPKNKSISEPKNLYKFYNYSFFQVKKFTNDSIREEAVIGLNRIRGSPYMLIKNETDYMGSKYEPNTNLIEQLKKREIIDSYIFSIIYNDAKEEGEIIFGEFPHEYDKLNYLEQNLYYNQLTMLTSPPFNYYSRFNDFFYDNQSLPVQKFFQISVDHGFIEAPLTTKKYFDEFFQKYNNSCKEEIIDNEIYVYYCKKEAVANFKNITFYFQNKQIYQFGALNDFELELNYKDLFIKGNKDNELYYFQIIFKRSEDWIFGKPIIKKYRFIFDQDRRIYGIYKNIEKPKEEIEVNNNNKGFNKIIILWIIIIILVICLIVESIYLIKKYIQKRNKKAYELNDDYDYEASLNKDEKNKIIN